MDDVRLLLVDFDPVYRNTVKEYFIFKGFLVDDAMDGVAAIKLFRRHEYNLILLDTAIPELEGRLVCNLIRKVSDVPIFITSDRCDEEEKLSYYEIGIDDFITKPISREELLARVHVFLRRTSGKKHLSTKTICCNGIHIDKDSRAVYINEKEVQLTPKEYDLLVFLTQNPNKAFSRETLLDEVWGRDFCGSDRTVDTHIKTLRESIKPCQSCIITVWGFGYKLQLE